MMKPSFSSSIRAASRALAAASFIVILALAAPAVAATTSGSCTIGQSLVDGQGNTWTVVGGEVMENGKAPAYSGNVVEIAYVGGRVFHENSSNQWYRWNSGNWNAVYSNPVEGCSEQTTINIQNYGAKGDGSDATAAIATAIQHIPSKGGTLLFPPGNYVVSAANLLPSNTHLLCEAGTVITAAPAASWHGGVWSGGITVAFGAMSGSNFEVSGCQFSFPYGNRNYGRGYAHILQFIDVSEVHIHDNVFDGGGDAVAEVGTTDTWEESNKATNVSNACYDHWGGFTNAHTDQNYCTTLPDSPLGVGAISFTGINTNQSAANSVEFEASGNTIYMNSKNGQCFEINGDASGGADNNGKIIGNTCIVTNNMADWGVLVTGHSSNGEIAGNVFENNSWIYSAVGVFAPASNWNVHDNVAIHWAAGSDHVFENTGAGGELLNNYL